jgi:DNA-binding MarR family transcriptional regulator
MDYNDLAKQCLQTFFQFYRTRTNQMMNESMRGEAYVLQYIANHDGDVVPGDISDAMSVSTARMATVLKGMENKGWISRHFDTRDKRRTILTLTQNGEEQADQCRTRLLHATAKMLEYLGENDAKEYIRILRRLSESNFKCLDE